MKGTPRFLQRDLIFRSRASSEKPCSGLGPGLFRRERFLPINPGHPTACLLQRDKPSRVTLPRTIFAVIDSGIPRF